MPVVARILWDRDGERRIDTVALGWTGLEMYVETLNRRYQFTAVWLDAADVTPR